MLYETLEYLRRFYDRARTQAQTRQARELNRGLQTLPWVLDWQSEYSV